MDSIRNEREGFARNIRAKESRCIRAKSRRTAWLIVNFRGCHIMPGVLLNFNKYVYRISKRGVLVFVSILVVVLPTKNRRTAE